MGWCRDLFVGLGLAKHRSDQLGISLEPLQVLLMLGPLGGFRQSDFNCQ